MEVVHIPKKRSLEHEYRDKISVRLPRWMLTEIEKIGSRTDIIEKAVVDFLKKREEEIGKK